ncbi:MAG TPA: hypothetical protein VKV28_01940 [Candidatus Binataceae bacterium]|nr:hypothetical protein [Candidatus Binataceae bacterium]
MAGVEIEASLNPGLKRQMSGEFQMRRYHNNRNVQLAKDLSLIAVRSQMLTLKSAPEILKFCHDVVADLVSEHIRLTALIGQSLATRRRTRKPARSRRATGAKRAITFKRPLFEKN